MQKAISKERLSFGIDRQRHPVDGVSISNEKILFSIAGLIYSAQLMEQCRKYVLFSLPSRGDLLQVCFKPIRHIDCQVGEQITGTLIGKVQFSSANRCSPKVECRFLHCIVLTVNMQTAMDLNSFLVLGEGKPDDVTGGLSH
jgi:hypothetical protein